MKKPKTYYIDLSERVLMTFAQAFAASWLVTQSLDTDDLKIAAVAGLVSLTKCLVAGRMGNDDSASVASSV